ncbi:MAG: tail fiber domain-containing protein [Bdellovibrionota bacterium]
MTPQPHNAIKILIFFGIFIFSICGLAINGRTTYQARIIKPDGEPLQASSVNFRFTVLNPLASCALYIEDYSVVNMANSNGLISFALGSGVRSFPVSATSLAFQNTFDNSTSSFACQTSGTYNPTSTDPRKILMQFDDGNGWQTLPALTINAVPYSMFATKANDSKTLNGKADTDFVENATLAALNCNTATHALTFNGVSFSCIPVSSGGGGGITSVTTSGTVLTTGGTASAPVISIQAATMSQDGYLTSLDYAEFKAKLSASSTQIVSTLGYVPVSAAVVTSQIATSQLAGDVSGTLSSNFIQTVGGKTASAISISVDDTEAATASATANAIVKRNSSGNTTFNDVYANAVKINYVDIFKPSTNFSIRLQAPASLAASYALTLPNTIGVSGQVISIDGSGNLSWSNVATGSATTVSASAPLLSTGGGSPVISITESTSSTDGYLSSTDWNSFNNKQTATSAAIIATLGYTPASATSLGNYLVIANDLSDLSSSATARTNLGLGTFATASSIDLGSASATGIIAEARLQTQTNVTSGTQYTKVTVDGKGRVTSGTQLTSSDVTTALGYTPANATSATQWITNGANIYYSTGNVGIGTTTPVTQLEVSGGLRISMESATCAANYAGTLRYNAGSMEYCNGISWSAFGVAGAGLTLLNGSTSSTQTFAYGTAGTTTAVSTTNGVHTLNIPLASAASVTGGLLSNADYVTFTNKQTATSAAIIATLGYTPASATSLGNYLVIANDLSDLSSSATARTNLGLGTFATASSIDLGSASATGIIAEARLQTQTNVTSGTQYTKVTVDGKGRVTSGTQLTSSDVTTALGYTPGNSSSGVTTINGSTSQTQTFAVDTTGTTFNIATLNGVHTFAVPLASAASVTGGLLSNADYVTFTNKQTATSAAIIATLGYTPASATSLGNYLVIANDLSDLSSSATARTNLGLGTFATASSIDLGSASATGTLAVARLPSFAGDVTSSSGTNSLIVDGLQGVSVAATAPASGQLLAYNGSAWAPVTPTSSQWNTSGTTINYTTGNVGIGTTNPVTQLEVSGGLRISMESASCAIGLAGTLRYNSGNVEYCNGSAWSAFGVAGSGLTSLNGSTSSTQTFAYGTAGTTAAFSTTNGVHTLNIPLASAGSVTAGLLSNADYTTFMGKITSSAASIQQVLGYVPANSATVLVRANNLSDLASSATARTNLGLGTFATASSIDLGSASATGIIAEARLQTQTNVTSGTQYTKVTVDGKGRVTSGTQLTSSDVTTALGYTPANATSATQWITNGANIYYSTGNVGIGVSAPTEKLHVSGNVYATGVMYYGSGGLRTDTGAEDASNIALRSGFYEASSATSNWYSGASSWQHLINTRHTNGANNYAMQIAGSFFDQNFWGRKTSDVATTAWLQFIMRDHAAGTTNMASSRLINVADPTAAQDAATRSWTLSQITVGSVSYATTAGDLDATGHIKSGGLPVIDSGGGWHRTYNSTGWFNATYGGGIYMSDSTWIRTYGSKNFYHDTGVMRTDGEFQVGAGERFIVQAAGNVGIGTSSPSQKLEVSGSVKATTFISTSDRRLKMNIAPVAGFDIIGKLRGVRYNWKANGQEEYGVIAQEVEKVIPSAVITDPTTGMKAVKYQNLIAPLIQSTKELYGICEMNKSQMKSVERRVANVEEKMSAQQVEINHLKKQNEDLQKKLDVIMKKLEAK